MSKIDGTALDERLTGHNYHCPDCNKQLTSLGLCGECGKRYDITNTLLISILAEYAHNSWSAWMRYLFSVCKSNTDGTITIPEWAVKRWKRQMEKMETDYANLPEGEKISDCAEAIKIIEIIAEWGR